MKHLGHWNSDKIVFKPVTLWCFDLLEKEILLELTLLKTNPCMGRNFENIPRFRQQKLGDGFKDFLCSPLFGEDSQFDDHIVQRGWFNHQPEKN